AARELDAHAHTWDAAQLAAQAALCAQDPRVAGTMLQLARSLRTHHIPEDEAEPDEPAGRARMTSMLSEREREVAALLLDGITYRDIGARLFISPKTVEHHVARIKRRLGADSRTELLTTLRAMKLGSAARGISRPA
ncbi:MAG TPA: helix-turn-helix transcriptional regulator, partial [Gordonia sp. (in: high G+C Gram-positive bacteria)]|nr:helix-turn-helix transcriptional regulator [Gordonia sp. (in: high G+C Gram-positive bacteria)]